MGGAGLLAVLPLIAAGFIFNVLWLRIRVFLAHAEGQKLFFAAATSGLLLALVAFLLYRTLPVPAIAAEPLATLPLPHAGQLLLTLILAAVLGTVANWIEYILIYWSRRKDDERSSAEQLLHRLTKRYGNPMRRFFVEAHEKRALVLVSLKSRKVYCGKVVQVTTLSRDEDQFIQILPIFSDVRDSETLTFAARTDYKATALWEVRQRLAVLEKVNAGIAARRPLLKKNKKEQAQMLSFIGQKILVEQSTLSGFAQAEQDYELNISDWVKHIPLAEIEIASVYDKNASALWYSSAPSQSASLPTAAPAQLPVVDTAQPAVGTEMPIASVVLGEPITPSTTVEAIKPEGSIPRRRSWDRSDSSKKQI